MAKMSSFVTFLFYIACSIIICEALESVYIVTSPDDHCPGEFTADETCLTLDQYTLDPIFGSNTSLRFVSGNHLLHGHGIIFDGSFDANYSGNSFFTMAAEGGRIVYSGNSVLSMGGDFSSILSIRWAQSVELIGVYFTANKYGHITIENVEEVHIESCMFDRVQVRIRNVERVYITTSSFSNYSYPKDVHAVLDLEVGALVISESTVTLVKSNFTLNQGAIHYHEGGSDTGEHEPREGHSLQIQNCVFTNNTSLYEGSAVRVTGSTSVSVLNSVFLFNSANNSGAAIYFSEKSSNSTDLSTSSIIITASTFLHNTAGFCGAFHFDIRNGNAEIRDSMFLHNSATSSKGGIGGAGCIRSATTLISNCSFVANSATGHGGALNMDENKVRIDSSVFYDNSARQDGGALFTYIHQSHYTIVKTFFLHNRAGDDGGAIFVGKKGSTVNTDECSLNSNEANDRGGAISVIGAALLYVYRTSIYGNKAGVGKQISACNSVVSTFLSGRDDPDYPYCHIYDNNITSNSYNIPTPDQQNYLNPTWVSKTVGDLVKAYAHFSRACIDDCSVSKTDDSMIYKVVHQVAVVAYVALAVSIAMATGIVTCIIVLKLRRCKVQRKRKRDYHLLSTQDDRADSDDEELLADVH